VLLACGAVVWLVIVACVTRSRAGGRVERARGEWLLAVVATEGLAVLAATLAARDGAGVLREIAVVLFVLGGLLYVGLGAALVVRLLRRPLRAGELTPDWWIVMGAAAIVALGAATLHGTGHVGPAGAAGVVAWALATMWIPVLVIGECLQARRLGLPRFTPARWTMVFPLGM
jgi:tellurite resistance protein TehA-like permease